MREDFTDYLRALDPSGEPPGAESFATVWEALRGALIGELKRRGLWELPPAYVGLLGQEGWQGSALDELVAECYTFVFLDRLDSLQAQLRRKANIEGLAFLNIRNFLYERRRQHDPLGFRVFGTLQSAVREAVDDGEMTVLAGDRRILNDTALAFRPDTEPAAARGTDLPRLARHVERWNDDLLPELITTRGKGHRKILAKLRHHLRGLEAQGFAAFFFRSLIRPLTADARQRWASVFEQAGGETAFEGEDDELAEIVALVHPESGFETRESLEALIDCVDGRLEDPQLEGAERAHLETLWRFLVTAAAGFDEVPSRRKIARLLRLPKNRLPSFYGTLGRLVRECQESAAGGSPGSARGSGLPGGAARGAKMSDRDAREQLRQRTGEAMAASVRREAAQQGQPAQSPRPGDVFLLPGDAGSPVEWVVLGADPDAGGRLVAVPADTNPMAGSADLALGGDIATGPLTLRLRFAASLAAGVFDPVLRRATLDAESLEMARRRRQDVAAGRAAGSPRQRDVDAEPAYEDWIHEVVEPAVSAVEAGVQTGETQAGEREVVPFPEKRRPPARRMVPIEWAYGLAAALAVVAVGLGSWVAVQRGEIARLERPSFAVASGEIHLNDDQRGPEPIRLSRESSHLVLALVIGSKEPCESYRPEVLDSTGRVLEVRPDLEGPLAEAELVLSRASLSGGPVTIRLVGICGGEHKVVEEQEVEIVFE